MTALLFSEGFKSDLAQIETNELLNAVFETLELLETIPTLGSKNLPQSVIACYRYSVRKLIVGPFDIIYEFDEEKDIIRVAGLIHQRMAR